MRILFRGEQDVRPAKRLCGGSRPLRLDPARNNRKRIQHMLVIGIQIRVEGTLHFIDPGFGRLVLSVDHHARDQPHLEPQIPSFAVVYANKSAITFACGLEILRILKAYLRRQPQRALPDGIISRRLHQLITLRHGRSEIAFLARFSDLSKRLVNVSSGLSRHLGLANLIPFGGNRRLDRLYLVITISFAANGLIRRHPSHTAFSMRFRAEPNRRSFQRIPPHA